MIAALTLSRAAYANDAEPDRNIGELSLEELMNVNVMDTPVTSVTKQKTRIADAPAAISVINQDDIRRSGLTSIPELLRLSPGMMVARANANEWAISARGFNDIYSNKLLVLQDGRTLYNPLFAGVFWEAQDYVLADLERIEVIRGPGATLWGANAVNGVINITSKSAKDTQGWLFVGLYGCEESIGSIRYGGKLDDKTFYRVYTKYRTTENQVLASGDEAHDGWDQLRGGFRIDRYASDRDVLTFQGDAYESRIGETTGGLDFLSPVPAATRNVTFNASGGNLLARWTRKVSDDSSFMVQAYYDRLNRDDVNLSYEQDTLDIEMQYDFALGKRQHIIWGAGYRFISNRLTNSALIGLDPDGRDLHLASLFIQDNITVIEDRVHLFLGSKFEYNSFSGFEAQPGARVLWTPNERNSVWGAVSWAVRTPRQIEEDGDISFGEIPVPPFPTSLQSVGNVGMDSEQLTAYEVGYRVQVTKNFSLDIAAFYNHYEELANFTQGTPFFSPTPTPRVVVPFFAGNDMSGDIWGAEIAATWQVNDHWRLIGSYTYTEGRFNADVPAAEVNAVGVNDTIPSQQIQLRSYLDITKDVELNAAAYYVSHLDQGVPSYVRLDLGVTWRIMKGMTLSVYGQNLLDPKHPEFNAVTFDRPSEAERTLYVQLRYQF